MLLLRPAIYNEFYIVLSFKFSVDLSPAIHARFSKGNFANQRYLQNIISMVTKLEVL